MINIYVMKIKEDPRLWANLDVDGSLITEKNGERYKYVQQSPTESSLNAVPECLCVWMRLCVRVCLCGSNNPEFVNN